VVIVVLNKNFKINGKLSITYQYDTGDAWKNLALETTYYRVW